MAKSAAKTSTHQGSFIYFWLGLLVGALAIIVTIMLQSAIRDGQASLLNSYGIRGITTPQTKNSMVAPQTMKGITTPQTKNNIVSPQMMKGITTPQTLPQAFKR